MKETIKKKLKMIEIIKKIFLLNDKNLGKQTLFWLAIFIPLIFFIFLCIPLWQHSTLAFNQEAYNTFLVNYKLPLYVLGTCVPLVAIVVYIHRTIQTEKQIQYTLEQLGTSQSQLNNTLVQMDITEKKNLADSYYAHSKYIIDALTSLPKASIKYPGKMIDAAKEEFNFSQPHSLYKKIFFKSSIEKGYKTDLNEQFSSDLGRHYKAIDKALGFVKDPYCGRSLQIDALEAIDSHILGISNLIGFDYTPSNHLYYCRGTDTYLATSFSDEKQIKLVLNHLYYTIQRISDLTGIDASYLNEFPENDIYSDIFYYMSSSKILFGRIFPVEKMADMGDHLGNRKKIKAT